MGEEVIAPKGEPNTVDLLNGYVVKMASKNLWL